MPRRRRKSNIGLIVLLLLIVIGAIAFTTGKFKFEVVGGKQRVALPCSTISECYDLYEDYGFTKSQIDELEIKCSDGICTGWGQLSVETMVVK